MNYIFYVNYTVDRERQISSLNPVTAKLKIINFHQVAENSEKVTQHYYYFTSRISERHPLPRSHAALTNFCLHLLVALISVGGNNRWTISTKTHETVSQLLCFQFKHDHISQKPMIWTDHSSLDQDPGFSRNLRLEVSQNCRGVNVQC